MVLLRQPCRLHMAVEGGAKLPLGLIREMSAGDLLRPRAALVHEAHRFRSSLVFHLDLLN
jgi:hypothetical protein